MKCKYCGKSAGLFRSYHPLCRKQQEEYNLQKKYGCPKNNIIPDEMVNIIINNLDWLNEVVDDLWDKEFDFSHRKFDDIIYGTDYFWYDITPYYSSICGGWNSIYEFKHIDGLLFVFAADFRSGPPDGYTLDINFVPVRVIKAFLSRANLI